MTAVKICGITRLDDALAAAEFGASWLGFVLWPNSPRSTTLDAISRIVPRLPVDVTAVGVFVQPTAKQINAAADAGIKVAQVHSDDAKPIDGVTIPIIRAVRLDGNDITPNVKDEFILLDAHDPVKRGGTGKIVDWHRAAFVATRRRIILAGGLTPLNVKQAIEQVRPYAVDVASGVEASPGVKDHDKLRAFIAAARAAEGADRAEGFR